MKVSYNISEQTRKVITIAQHLAVKYKYPRRHGNYLLMSVEFTMDPKKRIAYNAYNALSEDYDKKEEYFHKAIDNMVHNAFILSGVANPKTLLPFWNNGGKEIMQRELERLGMGNYV